MSAQQPPVIAAERAPDGDLTPIMVPETKGPPGNTGWSPVFAIEEDGAARYIKVTDWWGGEGTKPSTGYLGTTGVVAKAQASNLNVAKKFGIFQGISNAQGIATVSFGTTFTASSAPPNIGFWALPATAIGAVKPSQVTNSLTKASVQIKVEGFGLVGGVLTLLAGATVFVFAAEP
jgi:hypothetical protein